MLQQMAIDQMIFFNLLAWLCNLATKISDSLICQLISFSILMMYKNMILYTVHAVLKIKYAKIYLKVHKETIEETYKRQRLPEIIIYLAEYWLTDVLIRLRIS